MSSNQCSCPLNGLQRGSADTGPIQLPVLSSCLRRRAQVPTIIVANSSCELLAQVSELPGKMRKSFEGSSSPQPGNWLQQLTLRHTLCRIQQKLLRSERTTLDSERGCLQGDQGKSWDRSPLGPCFGERVTCTADLGPTVVPEPHHRSVSWEAMRGSSCCL